MPVPPYDHPLSLTMQTVATVLLWGGTFGCLVWAGVLARRQKTILPVMIILAACVGGILEPIYDILYHLHWYTGGSASDIVGEQWNLFTAFGLPQPVWVMPAYVMVFGLPALIMYTILARRPSAGLIIKMAAVVAFTTAVFEIAGNNLDLYGYYGEHPMRLFKYPLWIAFMESAQITGFAVICALLHRRQTRGVQCLSLFAIFPANFAFAVIGAGFPTLIAINVADPSTAVMWLTAPISIAFAYTSLWWTGKLLLADHQRSQAAPAEAPAPRDPVAAGAG